MRTLAILFVSALILAACSTSSAVREAAGHGFLQLQGASLVLNRALTVPAGKARLFIQSGQAPGSRVSLLGGGFNQYQPHCSLEVRSVDHNGFEVRPDTFEITRVQASLQQVVSREPIRVAALRLAGMEGGGDGSAMYHEGYHFWLASDRQPEVMRVSCYGVFAEPPDLQPPTLEEIRQALGDVAELRY
jgi:hypothetical protein